MPVQVKQKPARTARAATREIRDGWWPTAYVKWIWWSAAQGSSLWEPEAADAAYAHTEFSTQPRPSRKSGPHLPTGKPPYQGPQPNDRKGP